MGKNFGLVNIVVAPDLGAVTLEGPNVLLLRHLFKVAEVPVTEHGTVLRAGGTVTREETLGTILYRYASLLQSGGWDVALHLGEEVQGATIHVGKGLREITISVPNNDLSRCLFKEEDILFSDQPDTEPRLVVQSLLTVKDPPEVKKNEMDEDEPDHGDVFEQIGIWIDYVRDMGYVANLTCENYLN